jgi:hypothetical protein
MKRFWIGLIAGSLIGTLQASLADIYHVNRAILIVGGVVAGFVAMRIAESEIWE